MQGVAAKNDASYDLSRARASMTGLDHHRCLYCDAVPAERPHRDARLPGTDTVAFREVLPYLSLEPFRRCADPTYEDLFPDSSDGPGEAMSNEEL
jgi:hypothetical protein